MSLMIKKLRLGSISEPCSGLAPQTLVYAGKFLLWQQQLDETWTDGNTTHTTCQRKPWVTHGPALAATHRSSFVQHPWEKKRAASSTAPERTFHLKTWHAPLRRVTRSLEDCSYFSFSVLNFHTGFLITALQPVVKCQKNTSCYSNRYLQCNPDVEQVTASFPQCRNNNATLQLLCLSHRFI